MAKMRKKLLMLLTLLIFSLTYFPTQVNAVNLGDFKDENESHYYLDTVPDNPEDDYFEEGENNRGFFWFLDATEVAGEKFADIINNFANMAFTFNTFLTELMIAALELAYEFNFVNVIIDEISDVMTRITGISPSGTFSSSGIFGQLAIFVAILAVIYAVFMLLFKRSMFQSLGAILQTIICLTIAIVLFTNYAPFLKGINQVTTEMSALVLGSNVADETEANNNGLDESSLREKMYDNLWTMFVDRPYMYMMYGKTRLDDRLTEERVKSILKTSEGSEERLSALETEFYIEDNEYITHSKVWQRLSFTPVYISVNGITSILIYALALFLILFQFWFMMIAVFAPFALLIGAIPGMFNVTKRYFIELGLPLVLKIVVSFGALIVFSISEVLYAMDFRLGEMGALVNSTFGFYMTVVIVHWVLFGLLFLLRKRIANIFINSTHFMREMKDGIDTTTAPIKSAVQGTATVVGTGVGAVAGGPAGAMMGASIGKKAGETLTGEASVGDLAETTGRTAGKAYMFSQFSQDGSSEPTTKLTNDSKNNIIDFLDNKKFGEDSDKVIESLEKAGIENISKDELNQAHESIVKQMEKDEGLKAEYSDMLTSNLQQQHKDKLLKEQEEKLRAESTKDRGAQFTEEYGKDAKKSKGDIPKTSAWMDDSVDMYGDIGEQYAKAHSEPVNTGERIPDANSWISDEMDMYGDEVEEMKEEMKHTDFNQLHYHETGKGFQKGPIATDPLEEIASTTESEKPNTPTQPDGVIDLSDYEERNRLATLDLTKEKPIETEIGMHSLDHNVALFTEEGQNDPVKSPGYKLNNDQIDYRHENHDSNDPKNLESLEENLPK